jgi:phosphoglycolate phosphatase
VQLEADYLRHFVARADEVMVSRTLLYPGVRATLASLRSRRIRSAIVSTKFRYRIEAILGRSGLANAVDIIVGGEDVKQHKPDPEGLLYALQRLEVQASSAVYVGDHPVDAETAARAGTAFVAVRTGVSPPETWSGCNPVGVIAHVGELCELLNAADRG